MTYDEFTKYLKTIGAFYPEKAAVIKVYFDEHKTVEFEVTDKGVEVAKTWRNQS